MACISIANIVKTSLGPVGLDKMLVDDIGDTTVIFMISLKLFHAQGSHFPSKQVTNDGATILNLLEVEHPAGRVLVELAQLQVLFLLWPEMSPFPFVLSFIKNRIKRSVTAQLPSFSWQQSC